jgi:hypothetical protein
VRVARGISETGISAIGDIEVALKADVTFPGCSSTYSNGHHCKQTEGKQPEVMRLMRRDRCTDDSKVANSGDEPLACHPLITKCNVVVLEGAVGVHHRAPVDLISVPYEITGMRFFLEDPNLLSSLLPILMYWYVHPLSYVPTYYCIMYLHTPDMHGRS